ncbi:uncharacterized protein LOC144548845 [Carex rostrata]
MDPVSIAAIGWVMRSLGNKVVMELLEAWAKRMDLGEEFKILKKQLLQLSSLLTSAGRLRPENSFLEDLLMDLQQLAYKAENLLDELDYYRLEDQIQQGGATVGELNSKSTMRRFKEITTSDGCRKIIRVQPHIAPNVAPKSKKLRPLPATSRMPYIKPKPLNLHLPTTAHSLNMPKKKNNSPHPSHFTPPCASIPQAAMATLARSYANVLTGTNNIHLIQQPSRFPHPIWKSYTDENPWSLVSDSPNPHPTRCIRIGEAVSITAPPSAMNKTNMLKRKIKSTTNVERNWSELPEDILHLFAKKLHDISDFIRFRAVCKRWQLSAPVTDPPLQLPWLLEHRQQEHHENGIMRFYCLSSDPFEGGDIVVILSAYGVVDMRQNTFAYMMACWRPKVDNCIFVEGVGHYGNAYYMGQYFSNDRETGITNVIDIATKKLAYQVAPPDGANSFPYGRTILVESGGKILRLFPHYEAKQWLFDIYCLYFSDGEEKPCWVKIIDIGDQMLFVQSYRGLSFNASNFSGFKGNCIYFVKDRQYLCKYDIGDSTTEELPYPFDSVGNWFVPSLV